MKIEIETPAKKSPKYPYIGTFDKSGSTYVLFTAPREGIVLMDRDSYGKYPVGSFRRDWIEENATLVPAGTVVKFVQE